MLAIQAVGRRVIQAPSCLPPTETLTLDTSITLGTQPEPTRGLRIESASERPAQPMDLFQRARRVLLVPRSVDHHDQNLNNPQQAQAIPRSYGAINAVSPQLQPIQETETPARRRRRSTRQSRHYYDPPRTSCVFGPKSSSYLLYGRSFATMSVSKGNLFCSGTTLG